MGCLSFLYRIRNDLGGYGEALAARHLKKLGHKIVARNYASGNGEIDIISRHGDALIFTEVKTRAPSCRVPPVMAVGAKKKSRIASAASGYLRERRLKQTPIRFDIISVVSDFKESNLTHYKNVITKNHKK